MIKQIYDCNITWNYNSIYFLLPIHLLLIQEISNAGFFFRMGAINLTFQSKAVCSGNERLLKGVCRCQFELCEYFTSAYQIKIQMVLPENLHLLSTTFDAEL